MKKVFTIALLLFVMMGCTEVSEEPSAQPQTQEFSKFYASMETEKSRVFADEGCNLYWTADDRITIFRGNTYPCQYKFKGETGANSGEFDIVQPDGYYTGSPMSTATNYAVYPYDENTSITYEGKISYVVPTTQKYAENSFGLGANPMVAVTDGADDRFLIFKNLGGCFEFPLYGENVKVKSIKFGGNNGEKLAGKVIITATYDQEPTMTFAEDATETLTLDCGDGVLLSRDAQNSTKFWIVVPAITFENGFTITITDTNGIVAEKSLDSSITIERSEVQPFANALQLETIQSNQVWCYNTEGEKMVFEFDESGTITLQNFLPIEIDENLQPTNPYDDNLATRMSIKSIIIPEGVKTLGLGALGYCTNLESVQLPSTLETIDLGAFGFCQKLKSIVLPENLQTIGTMAFAYTGLESITIPAGVTRIDDGAFEKTALKSVVIEEGTEELTLGVAAFYSNEFLESVTIPSNVKTISEEAFNLCPSLSSVTLAEGVQTIGKRAFNGCKSLESITLPNGLTTIDEKAFSNTGLTGEFVIPNSVTAIGKYAFLDDERDSSITKITLSNKLTRIEEGTFAGCEYLAEFDFNGAPIEYIGERAFSSCNLGNFEVESTANYPSPGLTLAKAALSNCGAYGITLPVNTISIGESALSGSTSSDKCLKWIYCKATTPPEITDVTTIHSNNNYLSKVYVPSESLDVYLESWEAVQYKGHANGDYTYDETTKTFTYVGKNQCVYTQTEENQGDYKKESNGSYTYVGRKGDYGLNSSSEYEYRGENRGDYIKNGENYEYVGGNGDYELTIGVVGYRKTVSIVAGPPSVNE